MKFRIASAAIVLLASSVFGEVKITGPAEVDQYKTARLVAEGDVAGAGFIWDITSEDKVDADEKGKSYSFSAPPGTYTIKLRVIRTNKDGTFTIETARKTVKMLGKVEPGPIDPIDPVDPVDPKPGPVVAEGLRVLMLFESEDKTTYPESVQQVLYGQDVRRYLQTRCMLEADGKQRAFRIWDQNDLDKDVPSAWQPMMKRYREPAKGVTPKLPWIIIQNDKATYEGPLPENQQKALELLKKYGGV